MSLLCVKLPRGPPKVDGSQGSTSHRNTWELLTQSLSHTQPWGNCARAKARGFSACRGAETTWLTTSTPAHISAGKPESPSHWEMELGQGRKSRERIRTVEGGRGEMRKPSKRGASIFTRNSKKSNYGTSAVSQYLRRALQASDVHGLQEGMRKTTDRICMPDFLG